MRRVNIHVRNGVFAGNFVFSHWQLGESNAREVEEDFKETAVDSITCWDYTTEAILNDPAGSLVAEAIHFHFCDGLDPNEENIVYLSMNWLCARGD